MSEKGEKMLQLTMEEKKRYRDMLLNPGNLPFDAPEGYLDCLDAVDKEEVKITGSEGQEITVWITVPKDRRTGGMLYINIHGGGFVQPHHIWDDAICAIMALEFQCTVIDIDYRLAPEYPHPAAIIDCYDVYRWAVENAKKLGIDPAKIAVGGNSAGGTLTAGVCMKADENHFQVPALALMLYPECGLSVEADDPQLSDNMDLSDLRARGILYTLLYLQSEEQLEDPYANLLKADEALLGQFPDTILITGGLDPLRFDAEEFAKHLAVSGSAIITKRFRNSKHGFYTRLTGEWREAREFVFHQIHNLMDRA